MTLEGDVTVNATAGSPSFYGVMDLGPADRTFDVTGGTMYINGIVQGSNALIKTGAGTLALNNITNNDAAAVDVNGGVLEFIGGSSIDESSVAGITVASGATVLGQQCRIGHGAGQHHRCRRRRHRRAGFLRE